MDVHITDLLALGMNKTLGDALEMHFTFKILSA